MRLNRSAVGFSLVEAMVALGLGGAFLMSVISAWTYSTKIWKEESVRSTLRVQIESAMERVKEDTRLSDGNGILFYPTNTTPYTGISLPRATRNGNGFYTMSSGQIAWDSTIIYHIFVNGSLTEFRRTVLPTYNSSSATRQTQLDTAVTTGTVSGGTTRTLFKAEDITLEIVPQSPTFDGYAASVSRSSNTNFGSVRLTSGTHLVRFEVTGKNPSSSSYGIGIDSIALTPSSGSREAEALTVNSSSGASPADELMTPYTTALWGGNYSKNFACTAVGNHITFDVPYDSWLESNFDNMTHSNTEITSTNYVLSLASRETQGLTPNWQADSQTISGAQGSETISGQRTVRTVINGQYIQRAANMIRVKFVASAGSDLVINSAYFGVRQGRETDGTGAEDFSGGATQLYFDNATVILGNADPVGAVGAGTLSTKTVPAGRHLWSNWFEYAITPGAACPDYLVSMNVASGSGGETWLEAGASPTYSYRKDDTGTDVTSSWLPATFDSDDRVFAAVEVAGWVASGAATSQVYDTMMTAPAYTTMTFTRTLPASASVLLKARTSANSDMTGATAWTSIAGSSSSPYALAGIGSGRYVQFQATMNGASPYATYPTIDNVDVRWPGQTALVELSGYYTLKPSYGQFRVLVDGEETVKGIEIKLTASDEYRGRTYEASLNAEETARNTGK